MKTETNNIPKLRFPEYSGKWEKKKLGEIVSNKSTKFNPEKEKKSYKCIELEHLTTESGQLLGYLDSIHSGSIKNKFQKGDILFGKLRPYLKKYLIAPFDGVCSSEIWVLKGNCLSNTFLYAIIQTDFFIELANKSTGSKMPRADWHVVSSEIFSFPTLPEQTKIASFLTAIDEKIQHLTKKKALLQQYKKGVMHKIFNQEIRFKDERGNNYPDWEEKKMGEIGEIIGGGTPDTYTPEFWGGEIYWFTPTELKQKYVKNSIRTITEYGLQKSSAKILPIGSILITTRATIGDISISLCECATNQGFQSIIVNNDNFNEFIYYLMVYIKKEFIIKASGSTFLEINKTVISKIVIKLPILSEQIKIATFLTAIDNKIDFVSKQLENTQQYKKGLLQQMFV